MQITIIEILPQIGKKGKPLSDGELVSFEKSSGVCIPEDLKEYFNYLGQSQMTYNDELYQFRTLKNFETVNKNLVNFRGLPDFGNLFYTLPSYKNCFVIADYMFHMFAYLIRLYPEPTDHNEIYIVCGDRHQIIANSFTEFLRLYDINSVTMMFSE
ncbi:SMI1/KNR4 family protein [Flavihumibacter petaseus]|uniref:Knr4/Smi1-like domain-containing protein n=1 Tax=Flavihumibacter petaseus NBRC 106054 TaxID=1220578 RepID=A0A0E9N6G7_9BACT|nr:SMI1/KNR4 family protein [Flavihumibacter petaseus]GAO45383.1 hypothetical protein FPE01S_05_00800 [Flavihumibacter petaseus NBRC 106054]